MGNIYFLFSSPKHISQAFVSFSKSRGMTKNRIVLINVAFTITGALSGFLYWKFVGCVSGTCPIKSVWYLSTLWGLVMGYLLGDLLLSLISKKQLKNE